MMDLLLVVFKTRNELLDEVISENFVGMTDVVKSHDFLTLYARQIFSKKAKDGNFNIEIQNW